MVSFVSANEVAKVTIPAGEKIAVFSDTAVIVTKEVGYPNRPTEITSDFTTTAGVETVSSAYTNETVIYLEAGTQPVQYQVGSSPSIADPISDFTFGNATGTITGLAAAQGGSTSIVGGSSSTSANAGGAAAVLGGTPGATGVGGAATVTGAAGGSTSGAGGAATVTAGAGTAGNSAGGVGTLKGGAGQGTAAGGDAVIAGGASGAGATGNGGAASITGGAAASTNGTGGASSTVGGTGTGTGAGGSGKVTGGVGGATGAGGSADVTGGAGGATSGKGGAATVTGGAGSAGNASGGSVILQPGAKNGSGLDGGAFNRGTFQFRKQAAPATATDTATLTVAQMLAGIIAATPTGAAAYTMATGTDLKAACPTDLAADDSFDLVIINLGGTGDDITLTASTDITIVGDPVVGPIADVATEQMSTGVFRLRYTTGVTWIAYRIG